MSDLSVLSKFMGDMDALWKKFDKACYAIPRHDAYAFRRYGDYLDKFFVCYWTPFNAYVNEGVNDAKLKETVRRCKEDSIEHLETVWQTTAESLMKYANELREKKAKSRSLPALISRLQEAEECFKKVRKHDSIDSRITLYREAAKTLSDFIKKVERIA